MMLGSSSSVATTSAAVCACPGCRQSSAAAMDAMRLRYMHAIDRLMLSS